MRHSYLLTLLPVLLFSAGLAAQTPSQPFVEPARVQVYSPNAAELGKYGTIPVNYNNGLPQIEIPMSELRAKGYTLPVYLSYHASGIKPDQHPGWVGSGWSLRAGGCINRIVNGLNDDMDIEENGQYGGSLQPPHQPGYLYNCDHYQSINWTDADSLHHYYINSQYDTTPDEFQVCIDDISASFYVTGYDKTTGDAQIKIVSQTPVSFKAKIVISGNPYHKVLYPSGMTDARYNAWQFSHISSIILTKDNGTVYTFGEDENAIEYSYQILTNPVATERLNARTVTNTWHLKRINFPWGEQIVFDYKKDGLPIHRRDVHTLSNRTQPSISPGVSDDQCAGNTKALDNNEKHYNISFTVLEPSYLTSIYSKLTRDTLTFSSSKTTELKDTIYYDEFCKRFLDVPLNQVGNLLKFSDFLDKNYYLKLYTVSGKRDKYSLEFSSSENQRLTLLSLIKKYPGSDQVINRHIFQYETSVMLPGYNAKRNDSWGYFNDKYYGGFPGYQGLDTLRTVVPAKITAGILSKIIWPTAGYTEFEYEPNEYSAFRTPYNASAPQVQEHGYAGGVRIKRISNYDYESNTTSHRTFAYKQTDNQTSSGILSAKPLFFSSFCQYEPYWLGNLQPLMVYPATYYSIGSEEYINEVPLTQGSHVTYNRVVETLADGGKNEYLYTNHADSPDTKPEYAWNNFQEWIFGDPLNSFAFGRGLLKEKKTYNSSGKLIYHEQNSYHTDLQDYLEFPQRRFYVGMYLSRITATRMFTYFPFLESKIKSSYPDNDGNPLIETELLCFDAHRNRTSYKHTQGDHFETDSLRYSSSFFSGVFGEMQSSGHWDKPVEHLTIRDGIVTKAELTTWKNNALNGDYVVDKVYQANLSSSSSLFPDYNGLTIPSEYEELCWYPQYDEFSNPLQFRPRNAPSEVYRWDASHSGPSVVFRGTNDSYEAPTIVEQNINGSFILAPDRHDSLEFTCESSFSMQLQIVAPPGQNWAVLLRLDQSYVSLACINSNYLNTPWNYFQQYYPSSTSINISAGTHVLSVENTEVYHPASVLSPMSALGFNYKDLRSVIENIGSNNVFFEDFETSGNNSGVGYESKKSHIGPFVVQLENPSGTHVLDYFTLKNGDWDFVQTTFAGGNYTIDEGTDAIDNVRVYPNYALADSYSYYPLIGLRSQTDSRGITNRFEYDSSGRLTATKDHYGNPEKTWSYMYKTFYPNLSRNKILTTEYTMSGGNNPLKSHQYYDGFGRPTQKVVEDALSVKDIVQLQEYDVSGRPWRTWLPISRSGNTGRLVEGRDTIAIVARSQYNDYRPYQETLYDNSPLNRESSVIGPGQEWFSGNHINSIRTFSNSTSGPLSYRGFTIINASGYQILLRTNAAAESSMKVMQYVDEDNRTVLDFFNEFGQKVLSRQLLQGAGNDYLDTHYIYDWKGRLQAVLPPKLSALLDNSGQQYWNITTSQFIVNMAFMYAYDGRDRLITRKLPESAIEYFIYDKNDRLVYSQDGALRESGQWHVHLKDLLWRDCFSGTVSATLNPYSNSLSQISVFCLPSWVSGVWGSYWYSVFGVSLPSTFSPERIWYYDNYNYLTANQGFGFNSGEGNESGYETLYTKSSIGLTTGELNRVYQEGSNVTLLPKAMYYDWKGRLALEKEKTLLNDVEIQQRYGYGFRDEVLRKRTRYIKTNGWNIAETYRYTYDLMGKRLNTYFALNNSPEVLLSQVSYDPYGRMVSQAQGGHTSSYTYNIRSWLTEISNPYFLQRMQYQDVGSASQWGGNIAKMSWSAGPSATLNYYQYTYDGVSRLSSALYNGSVDSLNSRSYSYDLNSNITSVAMGQNTVSFALSGNRLSNGTYDSKGRLTSNATAESVTSVTYNPLDLPEQIVLPGNKRVKNIFLADGAKLQSRLCSPGDTLTKGYVGNLILHNGQPHTLLTENGYIDLADQTPQYRYFVKDHLGNNRVVTDSLGNVLQRNDYDPYGNALASSSEVTPYQYGGKEKIWTATLDWYDYCARYYQPILGRFTTIDPMSEKYYSISPYAYCAGNPVNLVDRDGKDFRKRRQMNTIVISANYYATGREAYNSAKQGVSFWNSRKEDSYQDPSSGRVYKIRYDLTVTEEYAQKEGAQHENTYSIDDSRVKIESKNGAVGVTLNKNSVYIKKSYALKRPDGKTSSTPAHEIGHTLGMSHKDKGVMSEAQDDNRTAEVPQSNIEEMMTSSVGFEEPIGLITRIYDWIKKHL